ncbi:MAG: gamma-glutamylcyclotransferase [Saprospiraceae bacterium]|nr:gamma-glutamylcyclotransferase [Saprospiraceae bacterium]
MNAYLFSYGTLQKKKVQMESFGRILKGYKDTLNGYKLSMVEITDASVLAKSEQKFHPIAVKSTNQSDFIEGVVFEISEAELLMADSYEVDDYKRVDVVLESGKLAWVYVAA